jgi:TPR repeat protein
MMRRTVCCSWICARDIGLGIARHCRAVLFAILLAVPGAVVIAAQGAPGPSADLQQASDRVAAEKLATELSRKAAKGDAAALAALASAADRGDPPSQFRLATLYKDGLGVAQNDAQYFAWLRKAAEQGHAGAQSRLIGVYEEGKGVPPNSMLAAQWARRAADQGELAGQLALVKDYYFGRGVAQSTVEAIKWQAILESRGFVAKDDEFTRELETAAGAVQTEEGRALAREWLKAANAARSPRE